MRLRVRPSFPVGPAAWPSSVPKPREPSRTGVHYDTRWARKWPARLVRALVIDDFYRPVVQVLGSPRVTGLDRLAEVEGPVIFAANHYSHIDTPLVLTSLPKRFRHKTVVAAAADYFFTSRAKGAVSALTIGAIPIERTRVNRRSADLAADLLSDGWSLVIFPEGGRSPDGWGQDFRGGAAYLAYRCGVPVIPVYVSGTRKVLKRGAKYPTPVGSPFARGSGVGVAFGSPLWPGEESSHRFALRVEKAVATMADEVATDWWTARRRAAAGTTPALTGPPVSPWRRSWALDENRRPAEDEPDWP